MEEVSGGVEAGVEIPNEEEPGRFVAGLSMTGTTGQIPLDEVEVVAERLRQAAVAMFATPVGDLGEGGRGG